MEEKIYQQLFLEDIQMSIQNFDYHTVVQRYLFLLTCFLDKKQPGYFNLTFLRMVTNGFAYIQNQVSDYHERDYQKKMSFLAKNFERIQREQLILQHRSTIEENILVLSFYCYDALKSRGIFMPQGLMDYHLLNNAYHIYKTYEPDHERLLS